MKIFDKLSRVQPLAPYLVIVFFIVSVAFSSLQQRPAVIGGWIMSGIIGIVFLRVAFPRSFLYSAWLLVIYILSGAGVLFFNGFAISGNQGKAIGVLIEVVALYIMYHLVFQVKGLRDIGEGPYVPLGIWSVAVLLFFIFSNGAFTSLVRWSMVGGNLGGYIGLETMLVLIVVFILVRAEQCVQYLEEGPKALRQVRRVRGGGKRTSGPTKKGRPIRSITAPGVRLLGKAGRKGKDVTACPICRSRLRVVQRTCPHCDEVERTAVCKASGHLFVPCPSCGRANYNGEYRCKSCDAKLKETILCRKCGTESDIQGWPQLRTRKRIEIDDEGEEEERDEEEEEGEVH